MLNKKSIELSLNFIVIIIISVVIFSFGILFIRNLSQGANEMSQLTLADLDQRISDLACEGSERVCISPDTKTISRKKFDVFGIKIVNVINDQNFDIIVSYPNPLGYKKDNTPIASPPLTFNPPPLKLNPAKRSVIIKKNEGKRIGIGVEVPANAVSGTYIFNVEIKTASGPYVTLQKFYVNVP